MGKLHGAALQKQHSAHCQTPEPGDVRAHRSERWLLNYRVPLVRLETMVALAKRYPDLRDVLALALQLRIRMR